MGTSRAKRLLDRRIIVADQNAATTATTSPGVVSRPIARIIIERKKSEVEYVSAEWTHAGSGRTPWIYFRKQGWFRLRSCFAATIWRTTTENTKCRAKLWERPVSALYSRLPSGSSYSQPAYQRLWNVFENGCLCMEDLAAMISAVTHISFIGIHFQGHYHIRKFQEDSERYVASTM